MEGNSSEELRIIQDLSMPLFQAKGWIKFMGILSIIYGVLLIFTLWGILICWLPIWIGVVLNKAGSAIEFAQFRGDRTQLVLALDKLRTFFTIQGVLYLIGLIVTALVIIILLATGASLLRFMQGF